MWMPLWVVCIGVVCQYLELVEPKVFKTKQECEKYALESALELQQGADRVGYKCEPVKDA